MSLIALPAHFDGKQIVLDEPFDLPANEKHPIVAGRRMVMEMIDDDMAEMFRRKTPAERLAATHAMWRMARARTLAVVKHVHPEWDAVQIREEMCRRMLGTS